jgi:fermentation-respiration switch protein FrsA (DUF1100 family)
MGRLTMLAGWVVAIVAAVLAIAWLLQRRLLYFPFGDTPAPDSVGLVNVEPVSFTTSDGIALGAWWVGVRGTARATVVVLNGNAGNRSHRAPLAAALQRHGFQVLLMDYRGYGGNPGAPSEEGLGRDSRAARAFVIARADVDPSRVVYFGESLGTAVAIDLASEFPPAALVLRSPFTSMVEIGQHHYPFLPVRWFLRDRYGSIDRIRHLRIPTLMLAGEHDRIVPLDSTRRLFDAANEPKRLWVLPDADHNDLELLAGERMLQAILDFLGPILPLSTTKDTKPGSRS